MIDKLISSHLVALALEDRQCVPTLDALWLPPQPRPPRARRAPWLAWLAPVAPIIVVFAMAGGVFEADLLTFKESPQLVIALVLVVMAMLGLVGARPANADRPLANVVAAGLFTVVAVAGVAVGWQQHMTDCVFFDGQGGSIGPCHANPTVTTTGFIVLSWAVVMVMSAIAARVIRRVGPQTWSVAAKLVVVTVLLTWLGVSQYLDRWIDVIRFQHAPGYASQWGAEMVAWHRVRVMQGHPWEFLRLHAVSGQWNAIEAGLVSLGLAVSIGVASMRERVRPSRWLSLLESPVIIPLGAIVTTASLVIASAQWNLLAVHRGDPDDIPWYAAWASVGAVVTFASMCLRRRRVANGGPHVSR
jgi:hypothetical protein